jgi:phosphoribosyl-AMP cyclohydrolase
MIVDFDKSGGLVPAIAQDWQTGEVLMMAWMNREAFEETVRTRRAVYFSRWTNSAERPATRVTRAASSAGSKTMS